MNNKIIVAVLLVLLGVSAFLMMQNMKLNKKIEELDKTKEQHEVKTTGPAASETKPANPAGASPFDKPNVDPLANNFTPGVSDSALRTTIKFDRTVHDFGKINEGDRVKTTFKFTNTGQKALVIAHAKGSCGCTVPYWPSQPIKPGESGEIDVSFDSEGKKGQVSKTVTVTANTTPPPPTLTIKSTVIPRDK